MTSDRVAGEGARVAEPDIFWRCIEPFVPWLHTHLRRLGVRLRDVPDVVQSVLIAVYRHWGEYDPGRPLQAWLRPFAHGAASDYRKRSDVRHEDVTADGALPSHVDPDATTPQSALEATQRRALLLEALEALDFDRRAVLVLTEFEGMSSSDIATMLDIPIGTVHSRVRLARVDLTAAVRRLVARRGER